LVERAVGERKYLHRIYVTAAARLHPGGGIGEIDALAGIARLERRARTRGRFQLTWQWQRLRYLDNLDRLRRLTLQDGWLLVVITDLWRFERRAAGDRGGISRKNPSSLDFISPAPSTS
jgi:hypothetical protein